MKIFLLFLSLSIPITLAQNDSLKNNFDDDIIICFPRIDELPKPIGGLKVMQEDINYPTEALINKIEGRVYVGATIDTLGNVSKAKIIKGIGYGCDEEALHIVKITKFTPATTQGRKEKCQISIPIIFKLPKRE